MFISDDSRLQTEYVFTSNYETQIEFRKSIVHIYPLVNASIPVYHLSNFRRAN